MPVDIVEDLLVFGIVLVLNNLVVNRAGRLIFLLIFGTFESWGEETDIVPCKGTLFLLRDWQEVVLS